MMSNHKIVNTIQYGLSRKVLVKRNTPVTSQKRIPVASRKIPVQRDIKPTPQKQKHPTSFHQQLNTHFYDGTLSSAIHPYSQEIAHTSQLASDVKLNAFLALRHELVELKELKESKALKVLAVLMSDYSQGRVSGANYDSRNDLYVDDLLYMCYKRFQIYRRDFLEVLSGQLEEMLSGMCPQGRTTRLFQAITAFD